MDLGLFQSSRWEILESLAEAPKSTKKLASELNTSAPNISQQLRQLEIAGLVTKQKTPGLASRHAHMIADSHLFIIATGPRIASKISTQKNALQTFLGQALFTPHGPAIVAAVLQYDSFTSAVKTLAVLDTNEPELLVISDQVDQVRKHHSSLQVKALGKEYKIVVWSHALSEFEVGLKENESYFQKKINQITALHDPEELLSPLIYEQVRDKK